MRAFLSVTSTGAAVSVFAAEAFAQNLTTIDPCPARTVSPIIVTAQYQPVSTCHPVYSCITAGNCSWDYGYETYRYVSTIIPCAYDGSTSSQCTVTSTDDVVVLSTASTTVTSITAVTLSPNRWHGFRRPKVTSLLEVRNRKIEARYDALGPLALPEYAGSNLCKSCEQDDDGLVQQEVEITECRQRSHEKEECRKKAEQWISLPAKLLTTPTTAVCASSYLAPSAGIYTFSFRQIAPARTVVLHKTVTIYLPNGQKTKTLRPTRTITIDEQPWNAVVTRSCDGPTIIDFTTTITTTVRYTVSYITVTSTVSPIISSSSTSSTTSSIGVAPTSLSLSTTQISSTSSSGTATNTGPSSPLASTSSSTSSSTTAITTGSSTSAQTVSSPSSSTATTTSSSTPSVPFFIQVVNRSMKLKKRDNQYVGFDQNQAKAGTSSTRVPVLFRLFGQFLLTEVEGAYVGTNDTRGSQLIQKFLTLPPGAFAWVGDAQDVLHLSGSIAMCVDANSNILALFEGQIDPSVCVQIDLVAVPGIVNSTSTGISATASSTISATTSATSSIVTTTAATSDLPSTTTTTTGASSVETTGATDSSSTTTTVTVTDVVTTTSSLSESTSTNDITTTTMSESTTTTTTLADTTTTVTSINPTEATSTTTTMTSVMSETSTDITTSTTTASTDTTTSTTSTASTLTTTTTTTTSSDTTSLSTTASTLTTTTTTDASTSTMSMSTDTSTSTTSTTSTSTDVSTSTTSTTSISTDVSTDTTSTTTDTTSTTTDTTSTTTDTTSTTIDTTTSTTTMTTTTTTTTLADTTTSITTSTTVTSTVSLIGPPGATITIDVTGMTYINAMLTAHNVHRPNHTETDLVWDTTLAGYAGMSAAKCKFSHDFIQGGGVYGQNIGVGKAGNAAAQLINNDMYNGEINNYPQPYGTDNVDLSNFESWGHYSQLVWSDTSSVGCATRYCPQGVEDASGVPPYLTFCNYSPAGNYVGEFSKVKAPLGGATVVIIGS